MNDLDAQAQLYIGIFDRLRIKDSISRERVFKTVLALQTKRDEILRQLEPNRPKSYRILAKIQQDITNSFRMNSLDDYRKIDRLFINLTEIINHSKESDTKESLTNKISQEISKVAKTISPSRVRLIYQLEDLSKYLLAWSDKAIEESSHEDSIDNLRRERNELANSFNKLFIESWNKDQEVAKKSQTIGNLEDTINRLCSQTSSAKQELNQALDLSHQKQAQLDTANKHIDDLRAENSNLQYKVNTLNHQIEQLLKKQSTFEQQTQKLYQQLREANGKSYSSSSSLSELQAQLLQVRQERDRLKSQIKDLRDQINTLVDERFAGSTILGERRRSLSGKYIGNLSDPRTKYHFNVDCPNWWSLIGQYLYGGKANGSGKEIVSSDSSRPFREAGLLACEKCRELG